MKDIIAAGGYALEIDVTKPAEVKIAVDKIIAGQGKIDMLFNNAGYAVYGAVESVSIEVAKR
jgi:NAD(P)-dependent dehydrogenase (short-subunit alcohol dehydrogenase family)